MTTHGDDKAWRVTRHGGCNMINFERSSIYFGSRNYSLLVFLS